MRGSKPCQAEGMLRQALILDGVLEEMAEQIINPLASKGVMLRQSQVFYRSWIRWRAFPRGSSF